jgi:hypothetical protein
MFHHLPPLWENCQDQNLLRTSILITLTFLVKALKADSYQLQSFLVPVLQFCTVDTQNPDRSYLVEQALELWHSVLQYSTRMTPELLALFPHWLRIQVRSELSSASPIVVSSR